MILDRYYSEVILLSQDSCWRHSPLYTNAS